MYAELRKEGSANSPLSIRAKHIMVVLIVMGGAFKSQFLATLNLRNYGA